MTVKELREELKTYNGEAILKIKVNKFSTDEGRITYETLEPIEKIIFERCLNGNDDDY